MGKPMPDSFFRQLTPDEEQVFRQWARDNYSAEELPEGFSVFHPVVRDEWRKLDRARVVEQKMHLSALFGVPLVDLPKRIEESCIVLYDIIKARTTGPREAVLLTACVYLFFVHLSLSDKEENVIEVAKDTLGAIAELLELLDD